MDRLPNPTLVPISYFAPRSSRLYLDSKDVGTVRPNAGTNTHIMVLLRG